MIKTLFQAVTTRRTQAEVDINALETWLEDNGIQQTGSQHSKQAFNTVLCIAMWETMETEFYIALYTEYQKCSCETETAIKILLEKLSDFTDHYYVQKFGQKFRKMKKE